MIIKRYTHHFHLFFFIYLYSIILEIDKVSFFQNLSLQNARTPHSSSYKSSFWGTFSSMSNFYELNFYYIFLLYLFIFFHKIARLFALHFPSLFVFFLFLYFLHPRKINGRARVKKSRKNFDDFLCFVSFSFLHNWSQIMRKKKN